jgi:hypothetical protein
MGCARRPDRGRRSAARAPLCRLESAPSLAGEVSRAHGQLRSAPETFVRKSEADRYLRLIEMRMSQGEWSEPTRVRVLLDDYATLWISQRPGLRPRTVDLYSWLLRRHISPKLGMIPLGELDTALIREWRAGLLEAGVTQGMAAKAYRLFGLSSTPRWTRTICSAPIRAGSRVRVWRRSRSVDS